MKKLFKSIGKTTLIEKLVGFVIVAILVSVLIGFLNGGGNGGFNMHGHNINYDGHLMIRSYDGQLTHHPHCECQNLKQ